MNPDLPVSNQHFNYLILLAFKEKLIMEWEDSKYLCKQRDRLVKATSVQGNRGQAPFQLDDMPEGCREFNYPNDDQHWAQVTRVCPVYTFLSNLTI
jgi:hypothetical protein